MQVQSGIRAKALEGYAGFNQIPFARAFVPWEASGVFVMQVNNALMRPLLGVALFQGLSGDQIGEIARGAERIIYRPGDTIIAADSEGDAAVLVVSGDAVRIVGPEFGGAGEIEVIAEGSLLGEMAMLVEVEHACTILARGQVRALRITREALRAQMERDPALADHFLHVIAGRLSRLAVELRAVDRTFSGRSTGGEFASLPGGVQLSTVH